MKSPVQPLDLSTTPLEAGSTLIEASAGTGKTYSVAGIVLRLLLEHQVDGLGNILVMTFTNAATAELIERIRQTLNDATALFSGAAGHTTDAFLSDMARAHRHDGLAVLTRALRDLDDLSVVTIHGFCHRMLEQHALETGTGFDIEYGADDGVLLARAAEDFWRRTVYPLGDLFAAATIYNNWTPTS
ncbi:MAG: exodeoxyribonuclease V subunit beta, partial [Myxococcales bacterium]